MLGSGVDVAVDVAATVADGASTVCVAVTATVAAASVEAGLGAVAFVVGRLQADRINAIKMNETNSWKKVVRISPLQ
jgi:hypothetical protein